MGLSRSQGRLLMLTRYPLQISRPAYLQSKESEKITPEPQVKNTANQQSNETTLKDIPTDALLSNFGVQINRPEQIQKNMIENIEQSFNTFS